MYEILSEVHGCGSHCYYHICFCLFCPKVFFSTKEQQFPKESESGQLLPPIPGEETDVSHSVYQMTDEVTFSPYTSQTLFRGDVLSWDETMVTIDVKSDTMSIRLT